jgi:hypothetical protein
MDQECLHPNGGTTVQDNLSEDDISVKFITPAIVQVGWDEATQIRRQVFIRLGTRNCSMLCDLTPAFSASPRFHFVFAASN